MISGVNAQGKLQPVFETNLKTIAVQDGQQGKAARGQGDRPWNRPDKAPDPLDIPGITAAYNRNAIDSAYGELIKSGDQPGTVGDVISVKTQGDYIAIMERGFRARHATPVRCIGHAMARRSGHSQKEGVFLASIINHVQNAWKAGQG